MEKKLMPKGIYKKKENNYICEITVRVNPDNTTQITKVLDPLFDAKILLEGVGVLVPQISEFSKKGNSNWKDNVQNLEIEDVIKLLKDYLEITGKDYKLKENNEKI